MPKLVTFGIRFSVADTLFFPSTAFSKLANKIVGALGAAAPVRFALALPPLGGGDAQAVVATANKMALKHPRK